MDPDLLLLGKTDALPHNSASPRQGCLSGGLRGHLGSDLLLINTARPNPSHAAELNRVRRAWRTTSGVRVLVPGNSGAEG